jgi:hypothetical protein
MMRLVHANIGRLNEYNKHQYKARLDTIWKALPRPCKQDARANIGRLKECMDHQCTARLDTMLEGSSEL